MRNTQITYHVRIQPCNEDHESRVQPSPQPLHSQPKLSSHRGRSKFNTTQSRHSTSYAEETACLEEYTRLIKLEHRIEQNEQEENILYNYYLAQEAPPDNPYFNKIETIITQIVLDELRPLKIEIARNSKIIELLQNMIIGMQAELRSEIFELEAKISNNHLVPTTLNEN